MQDKKIKIILVDAYQGNIPSLGLAYIASYLRQKAHIQDIQILQKKFYSDIAKTIIKLEPDMVGYFSITPGFDELLKIIKKVRQEKPKLIQIIGGPHITALPQSLPKEIDVGVIGEGEETALELVNLFKQDDSLPLGKLHTIQSLVFRQDGRIITTPRRLGIQNLDDIPRPARDLLNIPGYFPSMTRAFPTKILRASGIMTSRGCPFKCVFCQENALSKFRAHSAERAVEEMEELVDKYKVNFIQIMDDQFLINKERLRQIVELIRAKEIHKKAAFFCYLRADQINKETAEMLKQMNTKLVFVGFESGSDRILKYLKDPSCSVEKNQLAYNLCRRYKIHVYGSFIVGSPDETMEDIKKTYEFIKKNHMSLAEVFILTPLPGTNIWDYAVENNFINLQNIDQLDWNKLLIKMSDESQAKMWLAKNIDKQEYFKFYQDKIRPILWHYLQVANNFSLLDLFNLKLWAIIIKRPKYFLSVLKHSLIHLFKCR